MCNIISCKTNKNIIESTTFNPMQFCAETMVRSALWTLVGSWVRWFCKGTKVGCFPYFHTKCWLDAWFEYFFQYCHYTFKMCYVTDTDHLVVSVCVWCVCVWGVCVCVCVCVCVSVFHCNCDKMAIGSNMISISFHESGSLLLPCPHNRFHTECGAHLHFCSTGRATGTVKAPAGA